jgi:hypothetical protein
MRILFINQLFNGKADGFILFLVESTTITKSMVDLGQYDQISHADIVYIQYVCLT